MFAFNFKISHTKKKSFKIVGGQICVFNVINRNVAGFGIFLKAINYYNNCDYIEKYRYFNTLLAVTSRLTHLDFKN